MKTIAAKPPEDGPYEERHKDGSLACTGRYRNGLKSGEWKYYLKNGQLRASGECTDGKMSGE